MSETKTCRVCGGVLPADAPADAPCAKCAPPPSSDFARAAAQALTAAAGTGAGTGSGTRAAVPAGPQNATVRWRPTLPGGEGSGFDASFFGAEGPRRAIPVKLLFGDRSRLVIGRDPDADVRLEHPSISRHHAALVRWPDGGLFVEDLGSTNGVRVDGRRLPPGDPVLVPERVKVGIGPYLFHVDGETIHALDSTRSLRLEARGLEKVVRAAGAGADPDGRKRLLRDVNLAIEPGEFVALLGPSGCGKSTLMDCLNGRRPATGGRLTANGEDFYAHFEGFRQLLGYVPQKDIVHGQLTVHRALSYTAQLRLPADTSSSELKSRVEQVIRLMELTVHRDTPIERLSGGQIKRVSLGAELIARPCLLYIDEATSGLDAGTETRMMRLFRRLSDEGRSVLCITHNVDNVDLCDQMAVLAAGRLVYFGPPGEGKRWFGVDRISDIYDKLAEKPPEEWEKGFRAGPIWQEFVLKRLAAPEIPEIAPADASTLVTVPAVKPGDPPPPSAAEQPGALAGQSIPAAAPMAVAPTPTPAPSAPPPAPASAPQPSPIKRAAEGLRQFSVLTARYTELTWRDTRTRWLMLLQAPVVAAILLLGFYGRSYNAPVLVPRTLTTEERATLKQTVTTLEAGVAAGKVADPEGRLSADAERWLEERLGADAWKTVRVAAETLDLKTLRTLAEANVPIMPDRIITNPTSTYMLLFILCIANFWFGCNNAAKELVKEEAVYGRERAVNLGILPYVGSKLAVLGVISAVQTALLMGVIYGALYAGHAWRGVELPAPEYTLPLAEEYAFLLLLSLTGMAAGLALSACVSSPDRASTLLPYVLVPQLVLGGAILPIRDGAMWVAAVTLSPIYWAWRAVRTGECDLPAALPVRMTYDDSLWIPAVGMMLQTLVLLALTVLLLKRKDVNRG
jgi:ABC-type multidrug transport system ATPase subunit